MNIKNRLEHIEKKLNVGIVKKTVIILETLTYEEGTFPDIPGPYQDWITYQAALKKTMESDNGGYRKVLLFEANPFAEYEKRNGLPDGVLSNNEHRGQIPFGELLKKATKNKVQHEQVEKKVEVDRQAN